MSGDAEESFELIAIPNIVYVVDRHGDGWYCTGVDQDEPNPTGECVHEDEVPYARDFGG